jgi:hypothetical protein
MSSLLDLLKPVLWLAFAALLAGLASYLVVGRMPAPAKTEADYAQLSAPAGGDWNFPKSI